MAEAVKILAFAGSAREKSFNKRVLKVAVEGAKKAGAQVTVIDLRDYPMPLMDQDLEEKSGLPENARKVKDLMVQHDGFLIASPEYNSSITPLLKNTLDWASRKTVPNEESLIAYRNKVVGLVSASPGGLGGLRSLAVVRSLLGNIGVVVIPNQMAVSKAGDAFNDDGSLKDAKQQAAVEKVGADLTKMIQKLKS